MALEDGMAAGTSARRALNGILFLGGLELSYNVYGGTNSSPQTTEVFGGGERSRSLMRWVSIAGVKCGVYAVLASLISRSWWPFAGVAVSAASMHALYLHADRRARARVAEQGEEPSMQERQGSGSWRFQTGPTASRTGA